LLRLAYKKIPICIWKTFKKKQQ